MKKSKSSTSADGSAAKSRAAKKKSPFATPPHALGYNYLPVGRPLRASTFASVLPSVIAKYGLGRKLVTEKLASAWRAALTEVFGSAVDYEYDASSVDKFDLFTRHTRLSSFRGGVFRVEVDSNLLYQELQFQASDLLRVLKAQLPDEKLTQLKIVVR